MANLALGQYIPDVWYEIHRKNIDAYIDHFGQEVRLLKRTGTKYNLYSDIVSDISIATTEIALIYRTPIESQFLGPPLVYVDEEGEINSTGFFAYFKRSSLVRVDDILVIEGKSIEGDVVLDAFEVTGIKGKRLEQEFIRKFILNPFTDRSSEAYEDPSVLIDGQIIEAFPGEDVITDPEGFTNDFYATESVVPSPGSENFVTPGSEIDESLEDLQDIYSTKMPSNWIEGKPYDVKEVK